MPELSWTENPRPTWAECRQAVASVRGAEFGSQALASVRPRGVLGIIRSRGPLPLMLAVAAREGRLVWRDVDGFAVLEMPMGTRRPIRPRGLGWALLRLADRHWEFVVMAGPPAVLLPASVGVALLTRQALVPMLIVLAAVAYICVLMLAGRILPVILLWKLATTAPETEIAVG